MKITHIGHAAILVEAGGITLLSDPWWRGPCFGAQWWIYPAPHIGAVEAVRVDYIYISHGHHDHFHPGTLKTFSRDTRILVSKDEMLAGAIRDLGFQVATVGNDEELALTADVRVRIIATYNDDTLLTITDGEETCVNLNDALHSAPSSVRDAFIDRLNALHPRIDYLFCGYGVASHFPNCYVIPGKDDARTAVRRQQHFNDQWARIVAGLHPRFAFPFAADVVLLEDDLFWTNEPVHNVARPTEAFRAAHPGAPTTTVDVAPGFVIENGKVVNEVLRAPVSARELRDACADGVLRANRYGRVSDEDVDELVVLLRRNVAICKDYLTAFSGDWRFLIRLRNSDAGIAIRKRGASIEVTREPEEAIRDADYDVCYTVRPAYLKLSLTEPFGSEILFVGSGGIFAYASRQAAADNLHAELIVIIKHHVQPPKSRYGDQPKWLYQLKQAVKRMLGRSEPDLYDVSYWSVFHET
jgi:L-ascorbate metabolism protein UlaG (beta-lactamase superfamily)